VCLVSSAAAASGKVITLKFSNFFPAPHKNSIIMEQWCKEIEKRTNGKVRFNYFPGATLTPPSQTYDSVVKGIADVGEALFGYTMGKFPLAQALDLPLGARSAYVATRMTNEFYRKFKPKEFDDVKVMFFHAHGPGILNTRKPIQKLEDMKGLKVRSSGQTAQIVKALGGAPVGIPQTETYDALSKGVVDGAMSPLEAMKGWKLGEVAMCHTLNYGSAYSSGFFVVMNKRKWSSIPADSQKIIEQINEEWIEKQGRLWDEIDKEGLEFVKARGNKIIALSAQEDARWAAAAKPVIDDYVKKTKAKGLPAREVVNFLQDYLKKHQK
jgi:TRAP-type C4-dicarboxylate transport system substrate-binding protein